MLERYSRREAIGDRYSPLQPDVLMSQQEKTRVLVRCLRYAGMVPPGERQVLEVGCGHGSNLHMLLGLGFRPENLTGNELIEERLAAARKNLPAEVRLIAGDAVQLDLPDASFDIVLQSTVFTSILNTSVRQDLAHRMWALVKPGGGILWYDFAYNNPANPDVRGVPLREIRQLFPQGHMRAWHLTLAPPLARLVCRGHASLYTLLNLIPMLRTHWLCWIQK